MTCLIATQPQSRESQNANATHKKGKNRHKAEPQPAGVSGRREIPSPEQQRYYQPIIAADSRLARRLLWISSAISTCAVALCCLAAPAEGSTIKLGWNPVTKDANGQTLKYTAKYKLHSGLASGVYTSATDIGTATTATAQAQMQTATYFAVKAYSTNGLESGYSTELTVFLTNTLPVAVADSATATETQPVTIDVVANDTDANGDALTVVSVTQPSDGATSVASSRTVKYTASGGFAGVDSFNYVVSDTYGGKATGSVRVTVLDVTPPVIAAASSATVSCDSSGYASIPNLVATATVTDNCAAASSITVTQTPAAGTKVGAGTTSVTLTATDPSGNKTTASVSVSVLPYVTPSTATVKLGWNPVTKDANGQTLKYTAKYKLYSGLTSGVYSVATDMGTTTNALAQVKTLTPTYFAVTSYDTNGLESGYSTELKLVVTNSAPVAVADSATATETQPVTIDVVANDTDANGDALTVVSVTQPSRGSATVASSRTVKYTAAGGFAGVDTFTYVINDEYRVAATGSVQVTVLDVTPPAITVASSATISCDSSGYASIPNLVATATVTDNCTAASSITVTQTPTAGTKVGAGTTSVTLTATDASGNKATASVTVNALAYTSTTTVKLGWNPVTKDANGQTLKYTAKYKLHSGLTSGVYTVVTDMGTVTTALAQVKTQTSTYFAITAYSTNGLESGYSTELKVVATNTASGGSAGSTLSFSDGSATATSGGGTTTSAATWSSDGTLSVGGDLSGSGTPAPLLAIWANSALSETYGVSNLVDGLTNTVWVGDTNSAPWVITMDFGQTTSLDGLAILFHDNAWTNTFVGGSVDGTNDWFDVLSATNWPISLRYIITHMWDDPSQPTPPAIDEIVW